MFNNPGGKIKGLAKALFYLNLAAFVLGGIGVIIMAIEEEIYALLAAGIGIILVGIVIAWLSVLFVYAYGSMVEDVMQIKESLLTRSGGASFSPPTMPERSYTPAPPRPVAPAVNATASVCPSCGKPLAPGAVFCGNCGSGLRSPAQAAGSAARAGTPSAPRTTGFMGAPTDSDL